jgi:hypothetical protein
MSMAFIGVAWGGDNQSDLKASDKNKDGYLDRSELAGYFLNHDKKLVELSEDGLGNGKLQVLADDLADDALSMKAQNATKISIDDALSYVERRTLLTTKDQEMKFLWPGFGLSRTFTDEADPRKAKMEDRPFVISFSHDSERQGNKDLFAVLGTVTLFDYNKDWSGGEFLIKPGVDLDVDTSKDVKDSSVDFGMSFTHYWFNNNSNAIVSSHVLSLTLKFGTDRNFDRKVYAASLSWSFASPKILRFGYNTWIGGSQKSPDDAWFRIYWKPELGLEAGSVQNAAGSEELQKIKNDGPYVRFVAGGMITVAPLFLSRRLSTTISYKNRWDLGEGWNKYYWTAEVNYNIAKNVQFTVLYRKGAKPSSFTDTDTLLVGIGFSQ